jgi:uncharacterized iron-regulated membrane protein
MSMETKRPSPPGAPRDRYERRDADVRTLLRFGFWLFVTMVVVSVGMKWVFVYYAKSQQLGPPASPFENARVLPPAPRLQAAPRTELKNYRDAQNERLASYGWVDQQNGVVRIPIERAMDLLLERALPARATGGKGALGAGAASVPAARRAPASRNPAAQ